MLETAFQESTIIKSLKVNFQKVRINGSDCTFVMVQVVSDLVISEAGLSLTCFYCPFDLYTLIP